MTILSANPNEVNPDAQTMRQTITDEGPFRREHNVPTAWTLEEYEEFIAGGGSLTVTDSGYVVDAETGECLDHVDSIRSANPFRVTDRASADWVLAKILSAEADLAALDMEEAAIRENFERRRKRIESRRTWATTRFSAELEAFADSELAGGKAKTLTLTYGELSFRNNPGGAVSAKDQTAGIEWAEGHCPEAVIKTPRLVVTPLKEMIDQLPRDIFEVSEPSRTFTIKTGIKRAKS
ncbi:MAG TPA: hypothetical protein VN519_06495 [Bryobacteraceae bacterium]|nr:hypothetical protein [Bryobacteraceae bacterium]